MYRYAHIPPGGRYRYRLERIWDAALAPVAFVGLNPSTADGSTDDPTLRRMMGFAREWGYGGVIVVNLFALRCTDPGAIRAAADPVGPENDRQILKAANKAGRVIAAWGTRGSFMDRDRVCMDLVGPVWCIRRTAGGYPSHPSRLKGGLTPIPYRM